MERVLVRRCEEYDRAVIEKIIAEGMAELGYKPSGKVFVKPNVVFAGRPDLLGVDACTPAPFVGASLLALAKQPSVERVDMGEKSAVGIPTRHCYRYAGYYDEMARVKAASPKPVDMFCMEEEARDQVFIGGAVHSTLRISRKMARANSVVYLPKLKCHCVSNMTGAVKLNIGICSDDERSIRHDFLLNEKIVDLLAVGYPNFIAMDAIDVGVGNEAYPKLRKLGVILMGTNPVAVDIVGARLLGYKIHDIPYLQTAVERGYTPGSIDEISIEGDVVGVAGIDEQAKRILPYDDDYKMWQDVSKELARLESPMKLHWGPYSSGHNTHTDGGRCLYGCVMGIKMFLASYERYAGREVFKHAKPASFIIGKPAGEIDATGRDVYFLGTCSQANVRNARKTVRIDKCFTTATDMALTFGHKLGMPSPTTDARAVLPLVGDIAMASLRKIVSLRYAQDFAYFMKKHFIRRV